MPPAYFGGNCIASTGGPLDSLHGRRKRFFVATGAAASPRPGGPDQEAEPSDTAQAARRQEPALASTLPAAPLQEVDFHDFCMRPPTGPGVACPRLQDLDITMV